MTEENDMQYSIRADSYSRHERNKIIRAIKADDAWHSLSEISDIVRLLESRLSDLNDSLEHASAVEYYKVFVNNLKDILEDSLVDDLWV